MAAPLAATYVPPAPPLPAWLSITSSPTATAVIPYTVATLLPNGVPTLLTSAAQVTQYDTATLQLPITVDSRADVEGLDLGSLYTTAGGTAPTVVRELGGTRAFTLVSGTRALAAGTGSAGEGGERSSALTATATAAGAASSARSQGAPMTGQQATTRSPPPSATSSNDPETRPVATTTSPAPSGNTPAATSATASPAAQSSLQSAQSSLRSAQSSISAALASATQASTADPSSVASLRSALASASSALAVVSSASTALTSAPTSASISSSPLALSSSVSPIRSSPSSTSSPLSASASSTSTPLASDTASPSPASASERLNSLTPSQLAAAIAAPICFFFLLLALLLFCCCCVRRRRRKRAEAAALAAEEGDDGEGGQADGGGGGGAGSASQEMQEEQGLLGFYAGAGRRPSRGFGSSGRRHQRKITWEWVPARTASPKQVSPRPDQGEGLLGGRTSRASGRSVLAALTGGLFGAGAAGLRSPLSRRVDEEKIKGKDRGREEEKSPATAMSGAGLLAVRSASRASYSPVVGEDRDGAGGGLQDVDLTSPRLNEDDHGHFAPLPLSDDNGGMERVRSLQPLPPIVGTDGALRLSRYYTPPDEPSLSPPEPQTYDPFSPTDSALTFDASSPSSYDSPPLRTPPLHGAAFLAPPIPLVTGDSFRFGPVQDATRSLDRPRDDFDGADAAGGARGDGKRQTRLGSLSWPTAGRESVGTKPQQEKQLTPPPTPSDGDVPPRADTPSADNHARPVVSEMGWLSGRWSGLLRSGRGSDEEERVGSPDEGEEGEESGGSGRSRNTVASANSGLGLGRMSSSELFMNRPRWLGAPQSPSTPFLRLDPTDSNTGTPIGYDLPVHFHRSHSDPSSLTSGTDIASVSRYDDTPGLPPASWVRTPSLRAFPDSPLLHSPFTRADGGIDRAPFFHVGRSSFVAVPPLAAAKRQSAGGVSVLDRIAASFSARSGLSNAGLGIDEEGDEVGRDDSRGASGGGFLGTFSRPARSREISTESATDPFQHSLPLRPHTSPASPPRRPPRNIRRSQLRSSQTTPILFLPETDAPPLPFVALSSSAPAVGKRESGSSGRYSDPFEEEEGEVVWAGPAQEGERRPSKTVPDIASLQSVSG